MMMSSRANDDAQRNDEYHLEQQNAQTNDDVI